MKLFCLVLLGFVGISTAVVPSYDDKYLNEMSFKEKQMCILKLLNNIMHRNIYKEIDEIATNFHFEENYHKFEKPEVVKRFYQRMKNGCLPRGEIFCLYCEQQMEEVIDMFHVLYYAKDFATFIKAACYMRYHMNEGMFTYAFTVACRHRQDCVNFYLPAPYEVYPYFFVRSDVIQRAYLLKMNKAMINDSKLCNYYGIHKDDAGNYILNEQMYQGRTDMNIEDKLRYFTEDIDLNTYYYYFHIEFPFWMSESLCETCKFRRSEISFYWYQQLLARYYLERLSHGMCEVHDVDYYKGIHSGYWPFLRYHNGVEMPMRHNKYMVEDMDTLRMVEDYERLIRDAIVKGYYVSHDGVKYDLKTHDDIEKLGQMCQGKFEGSEFYRNYYRYLFIIMKSVVGLTDNYYVNYMVPSVLDNYETALRDPVFYQLLNRFLKNYVMYKKNLPSYSREELYFPGVKINNIQVDKLVTYFDDYMMDMSNAMVMTPEETSKMKYDTKYLVRKQRLNHEPFSIHVDIESDKAVSAMFRIFIGPKRCCRDRYYTDINENRENFVEIDSFVKNLVVGRNEIERRSMDMHNMMRDRVMTQEIMDRMESMSDIKEMSKDFENIFTGFPHRLMLPVGRKSGMDFIVYVIVTPYKAVELSNGMLEMDKSDFFSCRFGACMDKMPLGFPFDRDIDSQIFFTPNMKFMDVKIFHKDNTNEMRGYERTMFYEKYHMNFVDEADSNRVEKTESKYIRFA